MWRDSTRGQKPATYSRQRSLPCRARYDAYGVGLVVFVLLQAVERRLGIDKRHSHGFVVSVRLEAFDASVRVRLEGLAATSTTRTTAAPRLRKRYFCIMLRRFLYLDPTALNQYVTALEGGLTTESTRRLMRSGTGTGGVDVKVVHASG